MSKKLISIVIALVGIATVSGAIAHHSYQMFDTSKEVTYSGTLKSVEWTNPHMWFQVVITQAGKPATEYGFEGGSPSVYSRSGWHRNDVKLGDQVTVIANPLRNGDAAGNLVKIIFSNGAVLGRDGTRPDGSPAPHSGIPGAGSAP